MNGRDSQEEGEHVDDTEEYYIQCHETEKLHRIAKEKEEINQLIYKDTHVADLKDTEILKNNRYSDMNLSSDVSNSNCTSKISDMLLERKHDLSSDINAVDKCIEDDDCQETKNLTHHSMNDLNFCLSNSQQSHLPKNSVNSFRPSIVVTRSPSETNSSTAGQDAPILPRREVNEVSPTSLIVPENDTYPQSTIPNHFETFPSANKMANAVANATVESRRVEERLKREFDKIMRPSIVSSSRTDLQLSLGCKKEEEKVTYLKNSHSICESDIDNKISTRPRREFQSFVSAQEPSLGAIGGRQESRVGKDDGGNKKGAKSDEYDDKRPSMVSNERIKGDNIDGDASHNATKSHLAAVAPGAISVDGPQIYISRSNRAYVNGIGDSIVVSSDVAQHLFNSHLHERTTPSITDDEHISSQRQVRNSPHTGVADSVGENDHVVELCEEGDILPRDTSGRTANTVSDLTPVGAHVVTDHNNLLLVEATPLDESNTEKAPENEETNDDKTNMTKPSRRQQTCSTRNVATGICLLVLAIVLVVIIPLAQRFRVNSNTGGNGSTTPDVSPKDNSIQIREIPVGCRLGSNETTTGIQCLNSSEHFLAAATTSSNNGDGQLLAKELYVCPNTVLTISSSQLPIRIRSDNTTLCCVGFNCTIRSTNAQKPILHSIGRNTWIQRINFVQEDSAGETFPTSVEGGGLVIVEGGGTHFIDGCILDGGRATQRDGFQKFGGNLLLNGNTIGNALVNSTIFRNGAALRGGGGAFTESLNNLHVNRCTFENNTADNGGGLGVNNVGNVTLTNNAFMSNAATSQGENAWIGRVDVLNLQGNSISSATPEYGYIGDGGGGGGDHSQIPCDGAYVSVNQTCLPFDSNNDGFG